MHAYTIDTLKSLPAHDFALAKFMRDLKNIRMVSALMAFDQDLPIAILGQGSLFKEACAAYAVECYGGNDGLAFDFTEDANCAELIMLLQTYGVELTPIWKGLV